MPKPLTMTIEVEEVAFGKVFRTLDGMPGVVAIHLRGSGPKEMTTTGKAIGGRNLHHLVLAALADGPKTIKQLSAIAEANGKKAASVADRLAKMKTAKLIAPEGSVGTYKITAAGTKANNSEEK